MRISDWSSDVCSSDLMPRTVAEPRIAVLALARAQRLVHLGLQHRLHHAAHNLAKRIRLLRQQLFDSGYSRLNLGPGHGGSPLGRLPSPARHSHPSPQHSSPQLNTHWKSSEWGRVCSELIT